MADYEWTCAGCGALSPDRMRTCDCPTNVVCWDRKREWKRSRDAVGASDRCHKIIGLLYENPSAGLEPSDVDLIKSALKQYADARS